MIKRAIIVAFGAIIGVSIATRLTHKIREHASEMAAHCKEMMAGRNGDREVPSEREVFA